MQTRTHAINMELDRLQIELAEADYILKAGIRQKIKDLKTEYNEIAEAL